MFLILNRGCKISMRAIVFVAPRRKEDLVEGIRECSRLSCIKSAIEHRQFHHKCLARGVSHNLQEWACER